MSRWLHSPCPKCGSQDNLGHKEDDEWGFCFGCNANVKLDGKYDFKQEENIQVDLDTIETFEIRGHRERCITKTVMEAFDVRASYNEQGDIDAYFYPYRNKTGQVVSYKERQLPKKFVVHGEFKDSVGYFGPPDCSGSATLIITEGEIDALSVAQAQYEKYQKFFPVISLASASQYKVMLEHIDWLRSFKTVILWMDGDEAGRKAEQELAKIIGYDRVKIAKHSTEKDASDVLIKHGGEAVMRCVWDASEYSPAGVVRGEQVWSALVDRKNVVNVPYPNCLAGINDKVKGMRLGEIVLFTSGTGSGKSTVIKEIVLELLENTEDMIGMVSLEESIGDTAEKFVSMALQKNIREENVDEEELRAGFNMVFENNRLVLLDHQGSVSDDSLVSKLDHLALLGCKYIILDHITIAVSEGVGKKTGNEAIDSFMSDLLKITKKHNIWLGVISHLRKLDNKSKPFEEGNLPGVDDIKGSGSIKQISFDIIGFARNMIAESEIERNTIRFCVLKSRFTGQTGFAGTVTYDPKSLRLIGNNVAELDFE